MYNKNIEYLSGDSNFDLSPELPFTKKSCDFLGDLSKQLDNSKYLKEYPDIKTLAFWCRKKNILSIKEKFKTTEPRIGLGLLFHITPSNIPTNFAYSLIFGLLNGNSNIVRVPSKKFKQIDIICSCINELTKKKYKSLKKRITVIRYKSENEDFTGEISKICNARLIWGGDKTIMNVRKIPLNQKALDISFADRYSLSVINLKKIKEVSDSEINRLIEKFYNDTFVVDQNACSSPHLIIWLGNDNIKIRNNFWNKLQKLVSKKYFLPETGSIEKYSQLCSNAINLKNLQNHKIYNNSIYTVLLKNLDKNTHNLRGKWGYFYEYNTKNLEEIKEYVNSRYQTLTYFGLDKSFLREFVIKNNLKGIDRIVPIGQALDISFFWDGYDLNKILTRMIDIK
tara:strand:- start:175 stop:1362 length:1188 start_codon:yes stop_codon:yes gene_type:complete